MSEVPVRDEDGGEETDADGDDRAETVVSGAEEGAETTDALNEPAEGTKEGEEVGVRR